MPILVWIIVIIVTLLLFLFVIGAAKAASYNDDYMGWGDDPQEKGKGYVRPADNQWKNHRLG